MVLKSEDGVGWVGSATGFTPSLNYENGSQTGSREFDDMLDRK